MRIHSLIGALVAGKTAAHCLDVLAESRRHLGFRTVGFRQSVCVPVSGRLPNYADWASHAGWPAPLMKDWSEVGANLPDGAPDAGLGQATAWHLPNPRRTRIDSPLARRGVQLMHEAELDVGVTVRVPRPFGAIGCVTWFGPDPGTPLDGQTRALLAVLANTFFSAFDRIDLSALAGILSVRELECLHWAARGKTDKEIARQIGRSADTVRFHMKGIMQKLGARNRTHAVALSVHAGLVVPVGRAPDTGSEASEGFNYSTE